MLLSYYKGWLECAKYPAELLWDQSYRLGFVNENEKVACSKFIRVQDSVLQASQNQTHKLAPSTQIE